MNNFDELGYKRALDDIPLAIIATLVGVYGVYTNLFIDMFLTIFSVFVTLIGGLWTSSRIYHITHKDEVFGSNE